VTLIGQLVEYSQTVPFYRMLQGVYVSNLGRFLNQAGGSAEAKPLLDDGLRIQKELAAQAAGPGAPDQNWALHRRDVARSLHLLAQWHLNRGEPAEADALLRQVQTVYDEVAGAFAGDRRLTVDRAGALLAQGQALRLAKRPAEAEAVLRQALETWKAVADSAITRKQQRATAYNLAWA